VNRLPFEFNGVVRMTKLGGMYLLFTVLIGFSALNTGNNALYIGLAVMLGGILLSGISSKTGLRGIDVGVEGLGEAWAGSKTTATLRVHNGSRFFEVRDVIIVAPELDSPVYVERLGRGETMECRADFRFDRRGRAQVKHVDLYTRYPFALFLKKRRVTAEGETIVYPRLIDELAIQPRTAERVGDLAPQQRIGVGPELFALREYTKGDSVRQIHWKKSASLGRMVTIQSAAETARTVRLSIDPAIPSREFLDQFEVLISRAATYLHELLEQGCEVVLDSPGRSQRVSGFEGAGALFETLALLEPVLAGDDRGFRGEGIVFSLRRAA